MDEKLFGSFIDCRVLDGSDIWCLVLFAFFSLYYFVLLLNSPLILNIDDPVLFCV